MRLMLRAALAAGLAFAPAAGSAASLFATDVIAFFNSANPANPSIPFGDDGPGGFGPLDDFGAVTDGNSRTYISLPTGSFIVLGFVGGVIVDGAGDDLFVDELGSGGEDADVFISEDRGATFTRLGRAFGNRTSRFDLADIGFTGSVNAVKVLGLDKGGSSPGFDLAYVEGLEGAVAPPPTVVPLPAAAPLLLAGLGALALTRRRRR